MGFLDFVDKKLDKLNEDVERFGAKVDAYDEGMEKLQEEYANLSTQELIKIRDQSGLSLDIIQKRAAAANVLKGRGIED
ncbi:MAG: hypothetical protein ACI4OA_05875 [Selenomonadaceae bacterium]